MVAQAPDLEHLRKIAWHEARRLTRNRADQEDIAQEAMLAALQKPEYSTQAARWGARCAARQQRRAARVRVLEDLSQQPAALRPERRLSLHDARGRGGRFVPRGQSVVRPMDVEALKSLPTVRQVVDDLVRRALAACDGCTRLAAAAIGMGHTTLKVRLRAWRALGVK